MLRLLQRHAPRANLVMQQELIPVLVLRCRRSQRRTPRSGSGCSAACWPRRPLTQLVEPAESGLEDWEIVLPAAAALCKVDPLAAPPRGNAPRLRPPAVGNPDRVRA